MRDQVTAFWFLSIIMMIMVVNVFDNVPISWTGVKRATCARGAQFVFGCGRAGARYLNSRPWKKDRREPWQGAKITSIQQSSSL
jgi:hypothetical protein